MCWVQGRFSWSLVKGTDKTYDRTSLQHETCQGNIDLAALGWMPNAKWQTKRGNIDTHTIVVSICTITVCDKMYTYILRKSSDRARLAKSLVKTRETSWSSAISPFLSTRMGEPVLKDRDKSSVGNSLNSIKRLPSVKHLLYASLSQSYAALAVIIFF